LFVVNGPLTIPTLLTLYGFTPIYSEAQHVYKTRWDNSQVFSFELYPAGFSLSCQMLYVYHPYLYPFLKRERATSFRLPDPDGGATLLVAVV